jgi:hypothetical protein
MEESEIFNANSDISDTNDTNNTIEPAATTIIIPTSKIRKKHTRKINKNPTIKKAKLVAKLGKF